MKSVCIPERTGTTLLFYYSSRRTTEIKVYLVKTLLITQSFMQFEYELLDEAQTALIEHFIHQQQHEVKHHHLWEALK